MKKVNKEPFTDKRIASLLGDMIKVMLPEKDKISFKEDKDYIVNICFTVKDEYLIINDNCIRVCK